LITCYGTIYDSCTIVVDGARVVDGAGDAEEDGVVDGTRVVDGAGVGNGAA